MPFLTWRGVEEIAASTLEPYGYLVQLAALTGLRQGELFALGDRSVDLGAMTVSVERGVYASELVSLKTQAARRKVDLSVKAARLLRRQLVAREPNKLGLVFPSPRGQVLNDANFRHRIFAPAARRS